MPIIDVENSDEGINDFGYNFDNFILDLIIFFLYEIISKINDNIIKNQDNKLAIIKPFLNDYWNPKIIE